MLSSQVSYLSPHSQWWINSLRPSDTYICISDLTIIGSDNGLALSKRQAIIWTNDGILLTGHLGTNFSEILTEIHTFSFKKMHLKLLSGKWHPFLSPPQCVNTLRPGKMATILRIFLNSFSCMKFFLRFSFQFYWNLFIMLQLTIKQHWFR